MSVVSFDLCEARPALRGKKFLLSDHLERVAEFWGNHKDSNEERLYFLGGLCHDAAKARKEWQDNIRAEKRPIHAIPSAIIFSFYAIKLFDAWNMETKLSRAEKNILRTVILKIIRDICDHHSELRDIEKNCPWQNTPNSNIDFADMDLSGFHKFLCRYYIEFKNISAPAPDELMIWKKNFMSKWQKWHSSEMPANAKKLAILQNVSEDNAKRLLSFRSRTASFIAGDRFDAAQITRSEINNKMAEEAVAVLEKYCDDTGKKLIEEDAQTQEMVEKRQKSQAEALKQYNENNDNNIYTLALPTGLGKTLTSLRIALEACRKGKASRIIYAAPYISILSQASNEIANATELEVLQHHHLSVLNEDKFDDKDLLIMESWQAPVVTTTFNQLFRALFPRKAQDLIRLPAMQKAFVIIDEPQVMDTQVWNLFLAQIETAVTVFNCQILFISATLPPFEFGLKRLPYKINTTVEMPTRYSMDYSTAIQTESDLASTIAKLEVDNICAVFNTVKDSCELFKKTQNALEQDGYKVYTAESLLDEDFDIIKKEALLLELNGLMTPIHKEFIINAIGCEIKKTPPIFKKIIVISTQIIEAGVNLSFRDGYRASAIIPSYIQFAGRVNRHGGKRQGTITVVNFMRDGKTDSRKWVYTSRVAREETDSIMEECKCWDEKTSLSHLDDYYKKTFERNREQAKLSYFSLVAKGEWSLFAGMEPFGKSHETFPIFVPWPDMKTMLKISDYYSKNEIKNDTLRRVFNMMNDFNLADVGDIYEMYLDKARLGSLEFVQRKQFNALMQQFVVSVGAKLKSLGIQTYESPILQLSQVDLYEMGTGLGHHVGYEDRQLYF